ncbi:MAG: vitamin B12 transporter [Paracoccaceae bacterium]|jgi:vitamin B12 transporter
MKHLLISASVLAGSYAPVAHADDVFDLGNITVFANKSGQETDLTHTGATVEVVTEQDLQQAGETTVAEYLARLPGLSVSANGGLGASTTLRVRGLDGKYIKVLVDGIDVTDPSSTQTQFDWGGLTTSSINRIEVLKGSSSSLNGSRAIAGVVNITTDQRTETPGTDVTVTGEAGSFDTYRAGLTVATQAERGGLSFSLNRVQTDGFSARDGAANTESDGYEATQLNFSGDYQVTDTLTLGLSGFALNSEGDFDEFGGDGLPPFDEFNTVKTQALRGYAEFQTGAVQNTLSATYFKSDRISSSNGFATPFNGERRRLDYTGVYERSDALSYTFGGDWENESFDSGADRGETDNAGVFGEVLYAPSADLDLAASLRYDDHSDFGGNLSGRFAAAYRFSDATILRAVAATGFRAPSLYELNSTVYGNAALQPEESTSFELGLEQQLGGGSFVKATAFYTEIDNLIQFVTLTSFPAPFTGQYQQVAGTSTSKGIELSGEWVITDAYNLFGNYTYTDAKDANGARLLRVPGHDVVLGVEAEFTPDWNANLSLRHVADRPAEFGTVMEDYTVVNGAINYAISDNTEAYLRIENLFDEDYQTSANFTASERAFYLGFRATF